MSNPWESEHILKDLGGKPIPQIWDEVSETFIPYTGKIRDASVIWGVTVSTRPAASAVRIGTKFIAIDNGAFNITVSNGVDTWVEV